MNDESTQQFEQWRRYLTGVAYRMLGSVTESEDVVQDAYLRWHNTDHGTVEDPRAYLTTVTSRLCLDRLRSARQQRETYIGPWLPEPLVESPDTPMEVEALASDVSYALMLALERLSPLERVAFLLHDVFGLDFGQVAASLDRSEATCRQLASRARKRVEAGRPRYRVTPDEHGEVADRFFTAARTGDVAALQRLLSENVTLQSDGGGKRIAALRLLQGVDRICRLFSAVARRAESADPPWVKRVNVNGLPGWLTIEEDGLPQVTTVEIDDGRIQAVYIIRNPDKLRHLVDHLPSDGAVH